MGGCLGYAAPWTGEHISRYAPFRFIALPIRIIGLAPGLVARWILRRGLGWRPGAPDVVAQEIVITLYLMPLTAFYFAYMIMAERP